MPTISADYTTLFHQTEDTVNAYFTRAVRMIEREFGREYAQSNPALVGALVQAQAMDMASSTVGKSIGEFVDAFSYKDFHSG